MRSPRSRPSRTQHETKEADDHVLRRSEEPRVCAADQFQRRRQRQRRSVPARDAPDRRRRICRTRSSIARRVSHPAAAVRGEGRARDDAGAGQPGPGRRRLRRSRRACPASSAAASASPNRRASRSAATSCTQLHGHRQSRGARAARRSVPEGLRHQLHGRLPHDQRLVADVVAHVSRHHAVHVRDVGLLDYDLERGHQLGLPNRQLSDRALRLRVPGFRAADQRVQLAAGARVGPVQRRIVLAGSRLGAVPARRDPPDTERRRRYEGAELRVGRGLAIQLAQCRAVPDGRHAHRVQRECRDSGQRGRILRSGAGLSEVHSAVGRWLFKVNSELAYGDAFGETTALPPYRNRYAGGPGSVRGFKESTLGPLDSLRNPYGGNLLFANQFELVIPTPAKIAGSTRIALFYDVGNVFSTGGVNFYDRLGDPIDYDFDYDKLKKSVGIGVEWLAPLGSIAFQLRHASQRRCRNGSFLWGRDRGVPVFHRQRLLVPL